MGPPAALRVRKLDSGRRGRRETRDRCARGLPCFGPATCGGDAWSARSSPCPGSRPMLIPGVR